jgi:ABC-type glycerol-3-phosphate transport system substrate-binding protein
MKLRPFELILIVVFGGLFFAALVMLKVYQPPPDEGVSTFGEVTIWGVLPPETFDSLLRKLRETDEGFNTVYYKQVPIEDFDSEFVTALADQAAPDIVLIPHDRLVEHRTRLQPLSYESSPIRDFRSTYIDGAEVIALSDGIYGLPIAVDPLVLFWNRDIFANYDFLRAPMTWEEVVSETVPTLTVRDFNRNINTAAIAMGEYGNIKNAFATYSMLLLQGGSQMTTEGQGKYLVRLDEKVGQEASTSDLPFTQAALFYTNFSNTNNSLYSWNRSLRQDKEMFLSENLAMYFGFASEGRDIAAKNPNLSFDIAEVPQGDGATISRTYGTFYFFAIPRASKNKNGGYAAVQQLASSANSKVLADGYNMAPVHRSTLAVGSNDVYGRVAYISAIYARGWLNPELDDFGRILTTMCEDVNANRRDTAAAASDAVNRTRQIY